MNEPPPETPASKPSAEPPEPGMTAPAPRADARPHTPVKRVEARTPKPRPAKGAASRRPDERRDFFSEAMREALLPLSGLLERKINPILAALEALPDDVERLTGNLPRIAGALDQPGHAPQRPRKESLPVLPSPAAAPYRYLRPPGALDPGQFESVCSGCGKCVEVCPANAIGMDPTTHIAGGMPYIVAETQPCVVCDSLACMAACPTGALKLTDRFQIRMGTARVRFDVCLRDGGEDCRLCLEACPIMGDAAGPAGGALAIHARSGRVVVRRNACVGCGLCENRCPTDPAAITVLPYRPPVDPIIA